MGMENCKLKTSNVLIAVFIFAIAILFNMSVVKAADIPLITEWTIPVDADGEGLGTTIKLPTPKHENNNYTVDWGDGATETFDSTADFPTHTYKNTTETTYTIKVKGNVYGFGYYRNNDQPPVPSETSNVYTFTQYLTGLKSWGELGASRYGFAQCRNLSSTIPEATENTFKNVLDMNSLFFYATKLSGSIPENLFASATNATRFQFAFGQCEKLTGNIPEKIFANTVNATIFGGVFQGCIGLTGEIPEELFANTPKATSFGTAFLGCYGLTGSIPEKLFANTPDVTDFYRTFFHCKGLTGSIPEKLFANTPNVTSFGDTFGGCIGLTGSIPEKLFANTPNVIHFSSTFWQCTGLSGEIPANLFANSPNATNFAGTFSSCSGLTGSIPKELFANNTKALYLNNTFYGCKNLSGSIPVELFANTPEVINFGGVFRGCSSLNGNIPAELFANTTNVANFEYTFSDCKGLTGSIPVDLFKTTTLVTNFQYVFSGCNGLTGKIPANLFENTPLVTNFRHTFSYCRGLTGEIPGILFKKTPLVTDFVATFLDCLGLTGEIPIELFEKTPLVKSFSSTFNGCKGLTGEISTELFASNTEITTIPTEWKNSNSEDAFDTTFMNCTGITKANINTLYVGYKMFYGCTKLTDITIQSNVQAIGTDAFEAPWPYTLTNLLSTTLDTNNLVAIRYEWLKDNREITYKNALITEWTIPVDMDGVSGDTITNVSGDVVIDEFGNALKKGPETTIKLPIPRNTINNYIVDWGDGVLEEFDSTADFPTHTYKNTEETVYTISILGKVYSFGYYDLTAIPTETNNRSQYYLFTQYITGIKSWGELETTRYGFAFCTKLAGKIPKATENTFKNVTNMAGIFRDCSKITSLTEGIFIGAEKVTSFAGAFQGCSSLMNLPKDLFANTPLVINFGNVFYGCSGLKSLPENLFSNTLKVNSFERAFVLCSSLTNLPANLFENTTEVTSFYFTFQYCSKLESIPEELFAKTTKVTTFGFAFMACNGLKSIPAKLFANNSEVTSFSRTFYSCSNLTGSIPSELFKNTPNVGDFMQTFAGCSRLTGSIPEELFVNTTKVWTFERTFYGCNRLTGEIPEKLFSNTPNVTNFSFTFYGCRGLTGSIPTKLFENTREVTNFSGMFGNCSGITGELSKELFVNTKKVTNFSRMFEYCTELTGEIPEELFANTPEVTTFEGVFNRCKKLTGNIPANLFKYTTKVTNFKSAFDNCINLTGEIPSDLFVSNVGVTTIPEDLTKNTSEDAFTWMFSGCSNITSAKINTMYLGYQMFYSCNKLTDITIGNNVQKIGVDAFQATNPYSETNLLSTSLSSNNLLATFYDWASDNRTLRVETVSLTEKITGIENTTYHEDLKEALAATSDKEILDEGTQSVIKLYAAQSGDVVIGENKNIKLDLNGNSISTGKTVESIPVGGVDDVCITNNGTLEIIDETGEGEVAITTEDTVGGEVRTSAVLNNGTFKLTSGRLRNTSTTSYSTNSGALVNNGNATINDGTLETTGVLNAVNVQEGTVTFGKNDGLVGTSTPTIISETTAIVNEGGSFEFYDGNITEELEGQSDESINEIAYNTTILKTDNGNNTRTLTLDFDTTAFITEWTIPVDADEVSGDSIVNESGDTIISGPATTIKLPIPANTANMFVVDWGDGSEVESFDGAANFPTHTYNNTEKKVYTIKINGTVKNIGYVGGMFGSPTMTNEYKDYYTFTTYLTGLKQWGELSAETYGFSFCSKLSSTIPEPTTNSFKNVISMKALFRSCPKLTGTIPENLFKNAENITSFEYAFSYCNGLTGNIPAGLFSDTTKVLSFEGIFFNCKNLTGNIPSDLFVNTTQVTTFKEAFAYCYNLTGSIPEELFAKTENVTTFEHTFFASKKLSGSIPNNLFTNTSKVISFSGTFGGCENLIGNIPEELFKNTKKVQTFNGVFWNCSGLTGSIPIDLFVNTSEVQSFNQTFEGCIGLTGSIPASLFVNTTQVTTFNNTFYGCIGLSGSIPEELFTYTPSVTTFNSTFQNCTGLSGNIPAKLFEKTSQVTNFMYTFCGCTGLTGDIPAELFETNTAITTIPESMNYGGFYGTFNGCSNLTSASINTIYVGSQMFYGCNKITNITIGDNVQAIGTDAFEATEPYNATNLLTTGLRGVNSVATNYDWTSDNRTVIDGYALITEWTIPVDINGIGLGTTILLPIPKHNNNAYTVNWGDGSSVETFDSTADFPSHTYMNTVETVYTIQIKGSVNVFGYVGTYHPSQTNVGKNYCTFVDYLTGLKQWGELNATRYSFYWCENLTGSIPSPTENTFSRVTNMQDLFGYCETLIGPIPEDLFKSAKNVTSFNGAFQDCHDLTGSIPENLFANTTKVTDFSYTFFNCFELTGSIPEKLFWNTPKVTTFTDLFYQCTKLTGNIPKYLFVNNLEATKFDSVFKVCKGLTGGIPAELFEKNTKAIDFSATFMSCEGLTGNIPEKLFANNTKATDFSSTFRSCPNLTGEISEKLFENNLEVTTFFATFDGCKSLTGNIPSNLFANNTKVTTFRDTFSSCSSLTGSIPVELFKNNLNVTTFASTFYGCSSLTESIPENLFINNINVTTFGSTFYGCSSLTNSIPEDLFVNNIKVTTFSHTFYECSSLSGSIPEDLFKTVVTAKWFSNTFGNCINLSNNIPENLFESNVNTLSFNNTFSGCSNLKGNIPEKLFVNTTKVTDFTGTFNGCSGLIGTIPAILFEKTPNVEYFNSTFSGCSGLSGEIPATLFANTPSVYGFRETFANCTGLTGSIPIELFASNTVITDLPSTEEECFTKTFYNCSGLTSVNINTLYIGADMFYGCNNLTDITIGDKVKLINGTDAFQATDPYSATNPLLTNLTTDNIVPLAYDWAGDNRKDGTFIVKEPEDIKVKEFTEANFNVEVSGNNLSYQWYEVVSGEAIALTDKNVKIYKSNIEGQEGATATNTIIIKTDKTKLLSFEYMVSSEQEKDTFTVTIEDGNGIITAVDGISGEVDWTRYEKEIVPNENGEVILTLTYSKNNSVDIGGDFGAIRNLNCYEKIDVTSNFENDRFFTITTPDTDLMISNDWQNTPFSIVEEEGELVFKNHNNGIYHSYGSAKIEINLQEEAILTFDVMTVKSSYVEWAHVMIEDKDSSKMTTSLWEWNTYTETVEPNIHGKVTVNLLYEEILGQAQYESFIAIRNLNIKTGWNYLSSFVDDDMYMFSGNDWIISGYTGYKDSNLTIPAEMVNTTLDGNQYYCEISSPFGTYTTRQALLTVEEVIDPNEIFITEWKIPVDMDGVASSTGTPGTTIKLPIPSNSLNNYRVDWGDGTIEKFDGTANFPTHTYNNTTETVYEIKINGKVDSFGYYKETAPTLTDSSTIDYYTFTQYLTGIKQWGAIGLTRVGFANCINLVSSIPEPIIGTFENVTSMEKVFYACSNLSGTIPTNFFESATETLSFKDAFNGCKALSGNIPEDLFKTNTKATSFANTFAECTLLEGSIPSNLFSTNAEVTDFTSTFENCSKLSGEIPSSLFTTTTKVTSFANTFKGCMNLSGTIPQNLFIKNKEALDFSNTFNGCSKLSGMVPLRLFAFNDKATNFTSTFEGCSSITAADIQINTENVTSMDGMFKNCTKLESVVFEKEFKNLTGAGMFENCSALRAVILLNQATTEAEVGIANDLTTLGMPSGTIIYVPYKENEPVYESVWSNIPAERIERIVQILPPNPDTIGLGETYVDPGYTVAGFAMDGDEAIKWQQYGFRVQVNGMPVDTSTEGSKWIKYILYK